MNIILLIVSATFCLAPLCFSSSDESLIARKAEERSCTPCHSLRLVDSQRLSRTAWTKELDKMIGWGAVVPERQLLLDYLSSEYSEAKPIPTAALSGNGSKVPRLHDR
ncbi:MAG: hypothetical protein ACJ74Z_10775 [Bryobacteraceae bacterium]